MYIALADEQQIGRRVAPFLAEQIGNAYHWMGAADLENFIEVQYTPGALLRRFPDPGFMLCAWEGDELIATASFEPYGNPTGRAVSPAYVGNLYVHSDWRSQGVGGQMIVARESLAHEYGINFFISEVHQRNNKAKKFLRSQGFIKTGGLRVSSIHGNVVQSFCKGI